MKFKASRFTEKEILDCVSGVGAQQAGLPCLRDYDGKLRENWYIAGLVTDLERAPKKVLSSLIYETPLAIYRDSSGLLVAVIDRCLHRGAKLSLGHCEQGKIRCPYHGWAYGSEGKLCEVPSEGGSGQVKPWSLARFPIVEQDGVIWVWMGDETPAAGPTWRFPYAEGSIDRSAGSFTDKSWTGYFMVTDFHNEVTHLVENFMDVPHTVYVHAKWFRNRREIKVPITVELGSGRVLVSYEQPKDSIGFSSRILNPQNLPMVHTDEFIFPNITRVIYRFGERGYVINSQCTPLSRYRTRVYTWIAFHFLPGTLGRIAQCALSRPMEFYTRQVIEQDVEIMQNQGVNLQTLDEQGRGERGQAVPFKSTSADELHIAVERLREMGRSGDARLREIAWTKEREIWI